MTDANCIFCKIIKGESPASIEKETEDIVAFKSIDPVAKTHILIVPKRHIKSFTDIDTNENILIKMAEVAQKLIYENEISEGYKLTFNGGKYQAIDHVHWHLLGGELMEDKT